MGKASRKIIYWIRRVLMMKFIMGVVVGIALSTWGIEGSTAMVKKGIGLVQDGAQTVQSTITSSKGLKD